jgi:hypothetical protein
MQYSLLLMTLIFIKLRFDRADGVGRPVGLASGPRLAWEGCYVD